MNYGKRFMWTKAPESNYVAHGDLKSPTDVDVPQGSVVTLDLANPGYLKVSPLGTEAKIGFLLQNDVLERRPARTPAWDYEDREICARDTLSLFVEFSRGNEFQVTNRDQKTTFGRTEAAVTTHDPAIAFGDLVAWDGASLSWVKADTNADGTPDLKALGQCTEVNGKSITITVL